jgi:hypothetical protein
VTGLSLGYILTTEFQRRRIWQYWRQQWQSLWTKNNEISFPTTAMMNTLQTLVSPRSHVTRQLYVDIITLPPRASCSGVTGGVECWQLLQGTGTLELADGIVHNLVSPVVIDPKMVRTLTNTSNIMSLVVSRSSDGPAKDGDVQISSILPTLEQVQSYWSRVGSQTT